MLPGARKQSATVFVAEAPAAFTWRGITVDRVMVPRKHCGAIPCRTTKNGSCYPSRMFGGLLRAAVSAASGPPPQTQVQ